RDTAEVTGPRISLSAGHIDVDPRAETVWIHLVRRRDEQHVDALLPSDACVAFLVARVTTEIVVGTELRAVHEERYDDDVALATRRAHQRPVSFVEGTHRRDKPATAGRKLSQLSDDLHFAVASASTS